MGSPPRRLNWRQVAHDRVMRKLLLSAACFYTALAVMFSGNGIISWGLSHHGHETTPGVSQVGAALLAKYDGLYVGDTNKKEVYFTFDLGYEAGYTAQVLDVLKAHHIKATFFLCGNYLQETALIERMLNEGHQLGNHTNKHRDLPTLSPDAIKKDLSDLQLPRPAQFFRPPQGRFDEKTLRVAKDLGLRAVLWSLAIVDWHKTPLDARASADKVLSRIHPGAIMLFHITNAGTPKMLELLIPELQAQGYTFGALK